MITDFEGEPNRTPAERLEKHSPLRDVAGMLRSFDYAAASAVREASTRPGDVERLRGLARNWRAHAGRAFLRGYLARGASERADEVDALPWMTVFAIERALYEIRYEIDNRPDWLDIPLAGLLDVIAHGVLPPVEVAT